MNHMKIHTKPIYQLLDGLALLFACSIAYWFRFETIILAQEYLLPTFVFTLFGCLSLAASQHYEETNYSLSKRYKTAFIGIFFAVMSTSMFLYLTKTGQDFSRVWLGLSVIFSFTLIIFYKITISILVKSSNNKKHILVVGNNNTAHNILNIITNQKNTWLHVENHITLNDTAFTAVPNLVEKTRCENTQLNTISEVWVTHDVYSNYQIEEIHKLFNNCSIQLVFIPEFPNSLTINNSRIDYIEGIPTINSGLSDSAKLNNTFKFIEDKVLASIFLIISLPLILIIAILIKFSSKGPVFYKQLRYGINGAEFLIWKFRTMYVTENENEFKQATSNDPRITKIGKVLRQTSADEIPQLINVLIGNMSLVGPRPHPNLLNEEYRAVIDGYMQRHNAKPGITGLAQIKGFRGETPSQSDMENRILADLEYINNWSVIYDLKILFKTFFLIFSSRL